MATSKATEQTEETRGRKPSEFSTVGNVVLSVHTLVTEKVQTPQAIAEGLRDHYLSVGLASRVVHQVRDGAKVPGNTWRVQIAPADYEFPTASSGPTGARISAENAEKLRALAKATGQDADTLLAMALQKLLGTEE